MDDIEDDIDNKVQEDDQPILMDALCYIDSFYDDPATAECVHDLVKQEMKRMNVQENISREYYNSSLPSLPNDSLSPFLTNEIKRVSTQGVAPFNEQWIQVTVPGDGASIDDWKIACQKARALVEYQKSKRTNLELMGTFGKDSWTNAINAHEIQTKKIEEEVKILEDCTTELNRKRKITQAKVGPTLDKLQREYYELIHANDELKIQNERFEDKVKRIKLKM